MSATLLALLLASAPGPEDPAGVVVLDVDFPVAEIGTSGLVEVEPQWVSAAETAFAEGAWEILDEDPRFEPRAMIELPAGERALLEEHLTLFRTSVFQGLNLARNPWLQAPPAHSDPSPGPYTVGPGLRHIGERTGARYGLVIFGLQSRSSGGRIFWNLASLAVGFFPGQIGSAALFVGLIELETGEIVWVGADFAFLGDDPREDEGARSLFRGVVGLYPEGSVIAPPEQPVPPRDDGPRSPAAGGGDGS